MSVLPRFALLEDSCLSYRASRCLRLSTGVWTHASPMTVKRIFFIDAKEREVYENAVCAIADVPDASFGDAYFR
jgi:hypothetical protein